MVTTQTGSEDKNKLPPHSYMQTTDLHLKHKQCIPYLDPMFSKTAVFYSVKAETLNISIHLISDQLLNRKKLQKQLSKTFNCTVRLPDCAMLTASQQDPVA